MNTNTIQSMWDTRPARIPSDQGGNAKIAGVCEGIGVRYQVDPTLIRIIFVAAGLAGGGIGIYLLAWLLMPRYSMQYAPFEAVLKNLSEEYKKEKETGWWLIIGLLIFGFGASSSNDILGASAILTLGVAFAIWYFLHSQHPTPPDTSGFNIAAAPGFETPTPPSWDPLGAVPELWHLPEPGAAPEPKKKSHGWVWVAVAVVIIGISGITRTFANNTATEPGVSDVTLVAYTEDDLRSGYENGIGNLTLNLRELEPLSEDRTIEVTNGIGNVRLELPQEVPVRLQCDTGIGDTNCQPGLHHPGDGHVLTIKVDNGIGNLHIEY